MGKNLFPTNRVATLGRFIFRANRPLRWTLHLDRYRKECQELGVCVFVDLLGQPFRCKGGCVHDEW